MRLGTRFQRLSPSKAEGEREREREQGRRRTARVKEKKKRKEMGGCLIYLYILRYNKVKQMDKYMCIMAENLKCIIFISTCTY